MLKSFLIVFHVTALKSRNFAPIDNARRRGTCEAKRTNVHTRSNWVRADTVRGSYDLPVTTQSSTIGSPSSSSSGSAGVRRNLGASASLSTTSLLTARLAVRDRDSPRLLRAMHAYWPASAGTISSIRSDPSGSSVIRPSDSDRIGLPSCSQTISGRGSPDALQLNTAVWP
uniref:Uncharacterized protein n=1 Tax=Anopheles merus TaxID=30066 RepID=A0A182V2V8_ANOME